MHGERAREEERAVNGEEVTFFAPARSMERARRFRVIEPHTLLEAAMGRGLLLWLVGIPLPIILLIWLFGGLS